MPAELIPREVLFANPSKIQGSISPDGAKVAFLAPVDGVLNVWVQPVGGDARSVTSDSGRGIWSYFWATSRPGYARLIDMFVSYLN